MVMKKWENPIVTELGIKETQDELCYCEEGAILAYGEASVLHGGGGGWKPGYGPGHPHRPPHQGGQCGDKPKPPQDGHKPENDMLPGAGEGLVPTFS